MPVRGICTQKKRKKNKKTGWDFFWFIRAHPVAARVQIFLPIFSKFQKIPFFRPGPNGPKKVPPDFFGFLFLGDFGLTRSCEGHFKLGFKLLAPWWLRYLRMGGGFIFIFGAYAFGDHFPLTGIDQPEH